MNWKYLVGGCTLGGALALKMGAPLIPVVAGIAMAIAWNLFVNSRKTGATRRP